MSRFALHAIDANNNLYMWGRNDLGQLGDSTVAHRSMPVKTIGSSYSEIINTDESTFAKKTDGSIWCWGSNVYGQLGTNTTTNVSSPVLFSAANVWSKISYDYRNCLGIKTNGTLWAWGYGGEGMIGNNTNIHRSSPTLVSSGTDWSDCVAGWNCAYALKTNGTLWLWGTSMYGALADNTTNIGVLDSGRSSPAQLGTDTNYTKIIALYPGCCALKNDGKLWIWGALHGGMRGDNTSVIHTSSPVQVLGSGYSDMAGGYSTLIAKKTDGTIWTWGTVSGMNNLLVNTSSPVQLQPNGFQSPAFSKLNVGGGFSTTYWGIAPIQTIPPTPTAPPPTPTPTATPTPQNGMWVWGNNNNGCLGLGDTANRSSPVQLGSNLEWTDSRIVSISSSDGDHTIACKKDGSLWGWGSNTYGQLGNGTKAHRSSPVQIGSTNDWANAVTGAFFTIAVKTDGSLYTWGRNANGYLGNNQGGTDQPYPYRIGLDTTWSKDVNHLDSGHHTAAIKTNGTLWCWGANNFGQIGNNTSVAVSSPAQIGAGTDWAYVAVGGADNTISNAHTIGIKSNGTMYAWGTNNNGQLGDNSVVHKSSPVQIPGTTWKFAKPFNGGTIAIKTNGTLWSWGEYTYGCLGTRATKNSSSPIQIGIGTWNNLTKDNFDAKYRSVIATSSTEFYNMQTWGEGTDGVQDNFSTAQNNSPHPLIPEKNWSAVSQSYSRVFAMSSDDSSFAGLVVDLDPRNYTSGTTWNDATTFQNNASLGDGTSRNSQFYSSYSGAFYPTTYVAIFSDYDTSSSYITTSKQFLYNSGTSKLSYEVWFRGDLPLNDTVVMSGGGFTTLRLKSGTGILQASCGNGTVSTSSSVCNYNWHQAFVVISNNTIRLYLDGALINTASITSYATHYGPWYFNNNLPGNGGVPLAKARAWYNVALSDFDVLNSYNSWRSIASYTSYSNLVNFSYTGAMQYWTCPADVTEILAFTKGGNGGWAKFNGEFSSGQPGDGGTCSARLSVTPGTTYNIVVGGSPDAGGNFGYGGSGVSYSISVDSPIIVSGSYVTGAGGGLSGIFDGIPAYNTALIVAGGGGGGMNCHHMNIYLTQPGYNMAGGNGQCMTGNAYGGLNLNHPPNSCDSIYNDVSTTVNGGIVNGTSFSTTSFSGSVPMVGSSNLFGGNGSRAPSYLIRSASDDFGTSGGGGGVNGGSSGGLLCSQWNATSNLSGFIVKGAGGGASYIKNSATLKSHFFRRNFANLLPGTAYHGSVVIVY